ncbi:MAG: hypothetical protein VYC34_09510 [Planctomycetota bacterium]|nr:hypothetical protein [Planctomycetota bacterium]
MAKALVWIFVLGVVWALVGLVVAPGHVVAVLPAAAMLMIAPIGLMLIFASQLGVLLLALWRGERVDERWFVRYLDELDDEDEEEYVLTGDSGKEWRASEGSDRGRGYPAGEGVFLECLECGEIVPSLPSESVLCECHNIAIEVKSGRMWIQWPSLARLLSEDD